jgi:hypothetical protein
VLIIFVQASMNRIVSTDKSGYLNPANMEVSDIQLLSILLQWFISSSRSVPPLAICWLATLSESRSHACCDFFQRTLPLENLTRLRTLSPSWKRWTFASPPRCGQDERSSAPRSWRYERSSVRMCVSKHINVFFTGVSDIPTGMW